MSATRRAFLAALVGAVLPVAIPARTPKLNIQTAGGTPIEERKKRQIERLARQYDLEKWTVTRDLVVEQATRPHAFPVLTLNGRFAEDDDVALSVYVHEQGHWLLRERHRPQISDLYDDLTRAVPGLPSAFPEGSGDERGTYLHLAVILLEWQGMEELVGRERARRVMELQMADHYTAIYPAVLGRRRVLEEILRRYSIAW
jgi:hypothetical protein